MKARDEGFSLAETLVAMVLMLLMTASALVLARPSVVASAAQPAAVDTQQRARVAADVLSHHLLMAGAGPDVRFSDGPLVNFFPPILPRKMGMSGADPFTTVRFDAVTILTIAQGSPQTTTSSVVGTWPLELWVNPGAGCHAGAAVCGFSKGAEALVFDRAGHFDRFAVTKIAGPNATMVHLDAGPSYIYAAGATALEASSRTYYFDAVSRQLRQSDGYQTDMPVVDNVSALSFSYFGDPNPPVVPKPPLGEANCLYDAAGVFAGGSVLPTQGGSLAALPLSLFADGPWCGANNSRFDADLLRVRQVRVSLRVGVTSAAPAPDYSLIFDIAPRNLNLWR